MAIFMVAGNSGWVAQGGSGFGNSGRPKQYQSFIPTSSCGLNYIQCQFSIAYSGATTAVEMKVYQRNTWDTNLNNWTLVATSPTQPTVSGTGAAVYTFYFSNQAISTANKYIFTVDQLSTDTRALLNMWSPAYNSFTTPYGGGDFSNETTLTGTLVGANKNFQVYGFADTTPPTITISGVSEGATYTSAVAPTFSATDTESGVKTLSATLNGAGYTSGTTINTSAYYTLVVTAVDNSNNSTSSTVHFTVALNSAPTAPTSILVNGLSSGLTYIATKTPTFSAIFNDPDTGNTTSIAQVKVGTSSGGSEMWLSGDLAISSTAIGARCPNITYAGTTLSSRGIYYITMAFKDNSGVLGAFSTPVQFQIGWAHKAAGQSFPSKVLGQQPNKVDGLT